MVALLAGLAGRNGGKGRPYTMKVSNPGIYFHINSELLMVPHSDCGDPDCCGCLMPLERGDQADWVCNECGAVVRPLQAAEVAQILLETAMAEAGRSATCPHCGALNTFPGWSSIQAFVCRECGEGVVVSDRLQ